MTLLRRCFLFFFLLILLTGCQGAWNREFPTLIPPEHLPTVIALTVEAGRLVEPGAPTPSGGAVATRKTPAEPEATLASPPASETLPAGDLEAGVAPPTPSPETARPGMGGRSLAATVPPTARPTRMRTPTPTPTATPYPNLNVRIYTPGEASRVVSPLNLTGYFFLEHGETVRIELFGEDGRVLVRLVRTYSMGQGAWIHLKENLEFEISAVAEAGRLVVRIEDEFQRPVAVNSVDLILLSMGQADLLPVQDLREVILIEHPARMMSVQGGTLQVSGRAREMGDEPLVAELIGEDGRILGHRLVGVTLPGEDGYGTFAGEVPYSVQELTPARLVVYERGGLVSDMAHLSGVKIVLSP